jgi:hypothetical protein
LGTPALVAIGFTGAAVAAIAGWLIAARRRQVR